MSRLSGSHPSICEVFPISEQFCGKIFYFKWPLSSFISQYFKYLCCGAITSRPKTHTKHTWMCIVQFNKMRVKHLIFLGNCFFRKSLAHNNQHFANPHVPMVAHRVVILGKSTAEALWSSNLTQRVGYHYHHDKYNYLLQQQPALGFSLPFLRCVIRLGQIHTSARKRKKAN